MTPELIRRDEASEIWLADSLDPSNVSEIMGDRKANLLCVDAPYSEKTHQGHAGGKLTADRAASYGKSHSPKRACEAAYARRKAAKGESGRRDIDYGAFSPTDVENFCDLWVPRCSGWCVSITDDVLAPHWGSSFECNELLRFAPLPLVETGSRVRMMGDGPSNWSCWIVVGRPKNKEYSHFGTLPGCYVVPGERKINSRGGSDRVVGGKPLLAMLGIVGDYSRPGELVCDPCCGAGTALVAAKMLGRRAIGIDNSREHAELSAKLLADTRQQLVIPQLDDSPMLQSDLFGEAT
ncbi:MAG: DNA methyltransferase [Bryobacteraceae bacterium]